MRPITFELSVKIHSLQQPWVKNLFLIGSKMSFISTTEKGTQLGSFLYNVLGKDKKSLNQKSICQIQRIMNITQNHSIQVVS